jgi:hypothetical protein
MKKPLAPYFSNKIDEFDVRSRSNRSNAVEARYREESATVAERDRVMTPMCVRAPPRRRSLPLR